MKTNILIIVWALFGIVSCNSQGLDTKKKKDDKNHPKEEITVNRKFDEDGNLIEFDSTYSSYYSNIEGDTIAVDSIMNNFNLYFNNFFPAIHSDNLFQMDSTFQREFFSDNFFEKKYLLKDEALLNIIQEMDSIKNKFFRYNPRLKSQEDLSVK